MHPEGFGAMISACLCLSSSGGREKTLTRFCVSSFCFLRMENCWTQCVLLLLSLCPSLFPCTWCVRKNKQ